MQKNQTCLYLYKQISLPASMSNHVCREPVSYSQFDVYSCLYGLLLSGVRTANSELRISSLFTSLKYSQNLLMYGFICAIALPLIISTLICLGKSGFLSI